MGTQAIALLIVGIVLGSGCATRHNIIRAEYAANSSARPGAIDINSAPASELEKLPGIGQKTAVAIVRHREKFGKFRRPQHLILVDGMSERRYLQVSDLITVR